MYLKISLSDYGSVFNSRTKSWCWTKAPSVEVVGAAFVAVLAATILSAYWPFGNRMKVQARADWVIFQLMHVRDAEHWLGSHPIRLGVHNSLVICPRCLQGAVLQVACAPRACENTRDCQRGFIGAQS